VSPGISRQLENQADVSCFYARSVPRRATKMPRAIARGIGLAPFAVSPGPPERRPDSSSVCVVTDRMPAELSIDVSTIGIEIKPARTPQRLRFPLYNESDKGRRRLDFHVFNASYVSRLVDGDSATEAHFSGYFRTFIALKLRARRLSHSLAEDIQQETMLRVLKTLRQGSGISYPERFGAFVNSVCNNVILEFLNRESRHPAVPENSPEPADETVDLDASLITEERKRMVGEVLDGLRAKDKEILRLVFLEEKGREEVCEKLGVRSEYLRVLLHRAKEKFAEAYLRKRGTASGAHAGTMFAG